MNLTLRRHFLWIGVASLACAGGLLYGQGPKASPAGTAEVELHGKKVVIKYSRPYMKGRKIMGGLVPYGEVWRTGADEATSLTTDSALDIGGTTVPAGHYTLYTMPDAEHWKLLVNTQTGQWGTEHDKSKDMASIDLAKSPTKAPVEQFTISFDKKSGDSALLVLEWENTKLTVPVRAK